MSRRLCGQKRRSGPCDLKKRHSSFSCFRPAATHARSEMSSTNLRFTARAKRLRPSRKARSEEHTSELQSRRDLVCRLLLEKKNNIPQTITISYETTDGTAM